MNRHSATIALVLPLALGLAANAWAGPRGLASIVFGLLAYIALSGDEAALVAEVMAVTVVFSILLHGFSAGPIVAAYGRRAAREDKDLRDPG